MFRALFCLWSILPFGMAYQNCAGDFNPAPFAGEWTIIHTVANGMIANSTAFVKIDDLTESEREEYKEITQFVPDSSIKLKIQDAVWEFNAILVPYDSCGRMTAYAFPTQNCELQISSGYPPSESQDLQPISEWLKFKVKLDIIFGFLVIKYDDGEKTGSVALRPGSHDSRKLRRVVKSLLRRSG